MPSANEITDRNAHAFSLFEQGRYREAREAYQQLAEFGDPRADLFLGWMYQSGHGVERDLEKAQQHYQRLADAGSPEGQFYLASAFESRNEFSKAIEWLERAASQEYAPALYRLGRLYDSGNGVAADPNVAYSYFQRAARLGHVFAKRQLAVRLIRGQQGFVGVLKGLLVFGSVWYPAIKLAWNSPHSDLLQK